MKDVEIARKEAERLAAKVQVPGDAAEVMKRRYLAAVMSWYVLLAQNPYYCDLQKEERMWAGIDMIRLIIKDLGGRAPKPWGRNHLHKILYVPNNPEILYATNAINISERWQYKHRRTARLWLSVNTKDLWRISLSDLDAGGSLGHGGELLFDQDTTSVARLIEIGTAWVLRGERP